MFKHTAQWYDLLHSHKKYQEEVVELSKIIFEYYSDAETILDVACGTGMHDSFFASQFTVDGIDVNEEFLQVAQERNPDGEYFAGDMIDFHLDKKYDVIICLGSSIGYVRNYKNLIKATLCMRQHLYDWGMIIIEPWYRPDNWRNNVPHMLSAEDFENKICRICIGTKMGNQSYLDCHYVVGTEKGVISYPEQHVMGLFPIDMIQQAFYKAGLNAEFFPTRIGKHGLYIVHS